MVARLRLKIGGTKLPAPASESNLLLLAMIIITQQLSPFMATITAATSYDLMRYETEELVYSIFIYNNDNRYVLC